jgi:hypothetical protein
MPGAAALLEIVLGSSDLGTRVAAAFVDKQHCHRPHPPVVLRRCLGVTLKDSTLSRKPGAVQSSGRGDFEMHVSDRGRSGVAVDRSAAKSEPISDPAHGFN